MSDASDSRAGNEMPGGLGERIRRVRTTRGISVRELARRVGCSASLVSQVERGVTAPSAGVV
ncbi:MAG TPA: helix-turn-helix transcriptional regulator, partial [Mycobacterium sp.]